MRFHYDKEADGLYIRFDESPYAESDEVRDGVILDFNKNGKLIGIEVLDASQKLSRNFQALLNSAKLPASIDIVRA